MTEGSHQPVNGVKRAIWASQNEFWCTETKLRSSVLTNDSDRLTYSFTVVPVPPRKNIVVFILSFDAAYE